MLKKLRKMFRRWLWDLEVQSQLAKCEGEGELLGHMWFIRPGSAVAIEWVERSLLYLEDIKEYSICHQFWCKRIEYHLQHNPDEEFSERLQLLEARIMQKLYPDFYPAQPRPR